MEVANRQGTFPAAQTIRWLTGFAITWLVLNIGSTIWARNAFEGSWFSEAGPGSQPPWYFIGQDLFGAIGSAVVAVVMVIITFLGYRRLGPMAWGLLPVFALSSVADIGEGVNVLLHTGQIWQEGVAQSQWRDLDSYNASRWTSFVASLAVGVAMTAVCLVMYKRAMQDSGRG